MACCAGYPPNEGQLLDPVCAIVGLVELSLLPRYSGRMELP